ncbi:aminotransferase class V-fold PLP-dependent enzyme [Kineococcus sp. SYSU DK004]|uniref:aminotransferase class V-fold PLP-dependent enzyme n=1 Tax=Kineococcus sp. SYSU DK004 TaxID=3383125 RepID=UPI003D7DBA54
MPGLGAAHRAARPPRALRHLDSAAAGRSSTAVLEAVAAHTRREAEAGGYVAAAEAAGALDGGRAAVRALLGWDAGPRAGAVAWTHSAHDALLHVLLARPGGPPRTVLRARGEYGPNLRVLGDVGAAAPAVPAPDGPGPHRLDPGDLAAALRAHRPDLVHLTWLGSHAGTVQPVPELVAECARAGVPVVVDAAQALGHLDVRLPLTGDLAGADVLVYATSRKWLTGPRGVGLVAASPGSAWHGRLADRSEGHVAGRVGLAAALAEHLALGPERVHAGLARVGRAVREGLAGVPGWTVVEDAAEPSATVTLRPAGDDVDVAAVRARLLAEHGTVTTAAAAERAPEEMTRDVLRVSGHLDTTTGDVAALAAALTAVTGR